MIKKKTIKQKWYPYTMWEDYAAGLYRKLEKGELPELLNKAIAFTGDADLYGSWMIKVINSWPISCENNFTDPAINHRAWVGHAACCMAINCPENITRQAWWELSDKQRDEANAMADYAISVWINRYLFDIQLELEYEPV